MDRMRETEREREGERDSVKLYDDSYAVGQGDKLFKSYVTELSHITKRPRKYSVHLS